MESEKCFKIYPLSFGNIMEEHNASYLSVLPDYRILKDIYSDLLLKLKRKQNPLLHEMEKRLNVLLHLNFSAFLRVTEALLRTRRRESSVDAWHPRLIFQRPLYFSICLTSLYAFAFIMFFLSPCDGYFYLYFIATIIH